MAGDEPAPNAAAAEPRRARKKRRAVMALMIPRPGGSSRSGRTVVAGEPGRDLAEHVATLLPQAREVPGAGICDHPRRLAARRQRLVELAALIRRHAQIRF